MFGLRLGFRLDFMPIKLAEFRKGTVNVLLLVFEFLLDVVSVLYQRVNDFPNRDASDFQRGQTLIIVHFDRGLFLEFRNGLFQFVNPVVLGPEFRCERFENTVRSSVLTVPLRRR